jgi:hypothetical protein
MLDEAGLPLRPHRGALVLTFGILGWVLCVIFGVLAWVWGKEDLRQMDAGRMDPSGRGLTQAGYVLGMIQVIVFVVVLGIFLLVFLGTAVLSGRR